MANVAMSEIRNQAIVLILHVLLKGLTFLGISKKKTLKLAFDIRTNTQPRSLALAIQ